MNHKGYAGGSRLSLTRTGDTYVLHLGEYRRRIVDRILSAVADWDLSPQSWRLQFGCDLDEIVGLRAALENVDHAFSLNELHVIYSVLSSCSHIYGSEETFYRKTGLYRENALEVGFRMARVLEELSRAATEQSAD